MLSCQPKAQLCISTARRSQCVCFEIHLRHSNQRTARSRDVVGTYMVKRLSVCVQCSPGVTNGQHLITGTL